MPKPLGALVVGALALALPAAAAAPRAPVLTSVGHVKRHPEARWTLPQYVEASAIEVARTPEVASDGSFFTENVVVFDTVRETDTHWLYESQLDPGTYYVHVKGWDDSCFHTNFESECGSAWSNILSLTIPAPPPRFQASIRSAHPGAIRVPGSKRVWTYPGDTLLVSFRNAAALPEMKQSYRVCYRGVGAAICRTRRLTGAETDTFRLRVIGRWVPCRTRAIRFTWSVEGRQIAQRTAWVYECS